MLNERAGNQRLLLLVELEYLRTYTLYDIQNRGRQASASGQVAVINCCACGELERLLYHHVSYYLAYPIPFTRAENSSSGG